MSITDELREYVASMCGYPHGAKCSGYNKLLAIADRIDEAHKHAIGYVDDRDPKTMAENGWYRRPVDADGKPWLRGDKLVDRGGKVETVWMADDDTILTEMHVFLYPASEFRHAQPTVEDVLEELLREYDRDDSELTNGEIIERFAAKLRLAEEVDA